MWLGCDRVEYAARVFGKSDERAFLGVNLPRGAERLAFDHLAEDAPVGGQSGFRLLHRKTPDTVAQSRFQHLFIRHDRGALE